MFTVLLQCLIFFFIVSIALPERTVCSKSLQILSEYELQID